MSGQASPQTPPSLFARFSEWTIVILVSVMTTLAVLQWFRLLDLEPRIVGFDEVAAILAYSEALPDGLSKAEFKARVSRFQTELPFLVEDYARFHKVAVLRRESLARRAPDITLAIARLGAK